MVSLVKRHPWQRQEQGSPSDKTDCRRTPPPSPPPHHYNHCATTTLQLPQSNHTSPVAVSQWLPLLRHLLFTNNAHSSHFLPLPYTATRLIRITYHPRRWSVTGLFIRRCWVADLRNLCVFGFRSLDGVVHGLKYRVHEKQVSSSKKCNCDQFNYRGNLRKGSSFKIVYVSPHKVNVNFQSESPALLMDYLFLCANY